MTLKRTLVGLFDEVAEADGDVVDSLEGVQSGHGGKNNERVCGFVGGGRFGGGHRTDGLKT